MTRLWFPSDVQRWHDEVCLLHRYHRAILAELEPWFWKKGPLPTDPAVLSRMVDWPKADVVRALPVLIKAELLKETAEGFVVPALLEPRAAWLAKQVAQSQNGAKRAKPRDPDPAKPQPPSSDGPANVEPIASQSIVARVSEIRDLRSEKVQEQEARAIPAASSRPEAWPLSRDTFDKLWREIMCQPPTGNWQALSDATRLCAESAPLWKPAPASAEAHARTLVGGFTWMVDGWRAAKKPAPKNKSVEKFIEHFDATCDWLRGIRPEVSAHPSEPAPARPHQRPAETDRYLAENDPTKRHAAPPPPELLALAKGGKTP